MRERQPDLFETPADPEPEGPEEIRAGLGLVVPFSKSREAVKLGLQREEADRREPRTLTLDGRDEEDLSADERRERQR